MLSRKYLVFKAMDDGLLKYDYHYIMSTIVYKKMTLFNREYAEFLHEDGYRSKDEKAKKMKLFNISLIFNNLDMISEGIKIEKDNEIRLAISGYKEPLNAILQGFSIDGTMTINNIQFKMVGMESDKGVRFSNINIYKPLNPIIESQWNEADKVHFLTPYQQEYYSTLKQNLNRKYEIIYNKKYTGDLKIMIEDMLEIKPKAIKIKNGYLQGYGKFTILIQADKEMQKVAYYCGLGQNNSFGAGYLQYITGGE